MRQVTEGERLFRTLRENILESVAEAGLWASLRSLSEGLGYMPAFDEYLRGAFAIHVLRRLLRFWEDENEWHPAEHEAVRRISEFVRDEVLHSLGREEANHVARLVIRAHSARERRISPTTRRAVLGRRTRHECYLCAHPLDVAAREEDAEFLTLDHLWPSSLGGDSVPENLLPACKNCQQNKGDSPSWEWPSIHECVLSMEPSVDALRSVGRDVKIARHTLAAWQYCEENRCTLKIGFQQVGPMKALSHIERGSPIGFFDLRTTG